jgi:hypothetical protein
MLLQRIARLKVFAEPVDVSSGASIPTTVMNIGPRLHVEIILELDELKEKIDSAGRSLHDSRATGSFSSDPSRSVLRLGRTPG